MDPLGLKTVGGEPEVDMAGPLTDNGGVGNKLKFENHIESTAGHCSEGLAMKDSIPNVSRGISKSPA